MSDYPPPPPPPPPPGYQQYGYGPAPQAAPNTDALGRPLAEWWKRFVALLIDGFLLAVPTVVIFGILGAGTFGAAADASDSSAFDDLFGASMFAASTLGAIFSLAYYALLDGSDRGQTLGKMALKIQVRDESTGGPIGYGRGFVRHILQSIAGFMSCFGGIFILVDGLFPLWDPKRQTIHDKLAKTVVIDIGR